MKDRESHVKGEASKEEYEVETRPERRLSNVSMFQDALWVNISREIISWRSTSAFQKEYVSECSLMTLLTGGTACACAKNLIVRPVMASITNT